MPSEAIQMPMREIGQFLQRIYALQEVASLYAVIVDGMGELIPGNNVFIGEHDMRDTLVTGCAVKHMFTTPDFMAIVNSCAGQHPLWEPIRLGGQQVRCLSDHATAPAWEDTRLYREALGRDGVRDHISIEFGNRRADLLSVGVFRDRRGFSERERAVMRFLIPHIEQALGNCRLAEASGLVGQLNVDGRRHARVEVSAEGTAEPLNRESRMILGQFFDASSLRHGHLPVRIGDWLRRAWQQLQRGGLEGAIRPFTLDCYPWRLQLVLVKRRMLPGAQIILLMEPIAATCNAQLSPRENEVLRWVREGKSNDEIAIILGTRVSTIKTHLKHIFRKLGVENRTAAARFWQTRHG